MLTTRPRKPLLPVRTEGSVGIATRYGLDGLGIESPVGGEISRIGPDMPWGPPSLLYSRFWVSFPGVSGRGVTLTNDPDLAPRLKKE
jgi:hypothetical protein